MIVPVLFEDDAFLVCEKPVGTDSEHALPALLQEQCKTTVFPVHRLDSAVGGVMVFAKRRRDAAALSAMIQNRRFQKEYLAVVHGVPEAESGTWRDLLYHDRRRNKSFVVQRERRGVREAVLDYETLAALPEEGCSLLRIHLHTGRTHQIRVQAASRQMPLWGDHRYGAQDEGRQIALFSHRIAFFHPRTGEAVSFTAPVPQSFPWNCFPNL